jgi:hypothetical protein
MHLDKIKLIRIEFPLKFERKVYVLNCIMKCGYLA